MEQVELIEFLANNILKKKKNKPLLVGINGIDASGKTILAKKLVKKLEESNLKIVYSSIDYFHNPENIRYKKGKNSAEGYYFDSFNNEKLKKYLLDPIYSGNGFYKTKFFDYKINSTIDSKFQEVSDNIILIMEGIFLFRPELEKYRDIKIFIDVDFDIILDRVVKREAEINHIGSESEIIFKYKNRYIPGQKIYFSQSDPKKQADIIIDNNKFENPILIK